jgi:hypothetical protein
MSKGMTITSEIVMGIGMITLGVIFSLISSQIIAGQQSNILGGAQNEMAAELQQNIELVQGFEDTTKISYTPPVDLYTIEVREGDIVLDIEGEETANFGTQSVKIQDTNIEDSDELCIIKNSTQVKISQKSCKSIDKSELCRDGCDPNSCQPQYGDTCSTPACEYPEHAESDEATEYCEPGYKPDYIDEGESTTDMGFVDQDYTQVQGKGDRCTKNFECGETSGENLECNAAIASGPSGSYCCPSGESWTGSECKTNEKFNIVYAPARYSSQSNFETDANNAHSYLISKAPFNECSNPDDAVKKTLIDKSECDIDTCDMSIENPPCYQQMRQCANDELGVGNWNKIIGLAQGTGPFITLPGGRTGRICGKANSIPGDVSVTYNTCGPVTAAHEAGHSFGLFHIDGGGGASGTVCDLSGEQPNEDDGKCEGTPLSEREEFIMSYSDNRQRYGPAGFEHLENNVLDSALEVCS